MSGSVKQRDSQTRYSQNVTLKKHPYVESILSFLLLQQTAVTALLMLGWGLETSRASLTLSSSLLVLLASLSQATPGFNDHQCTVPTSRSRSASPRPSAWRPLHGNSKSLPIVDDVIRTLTLHYRDDLDMTQWPWPRSVLNAKRYAKSSLVFSSKRKLKYKDDSN